jgi:hypothetical protein
MLEYQERLKKKQQQSKEDSHLWLYDSIDSGYMHVDLCDSFVVEAVFGPRRNEDRIRIQCNHDSGHGRLCAGWRAR